MEENHGLAGMILKNGLLSTETRFNTGILQIGNTLLPVSLMEDEMAFMCEQ
ncbi:MAG: hypothetical protein H0V82_05775 [Candidatus Protochlamydia sp.]|nr:hypothetical protein [Candidatus Protochlamydia sp.]